MLKHAYMIMVHKLDRTFEVLLSLLDDCRNDIFVHVDKKTGDIDFRKYNSLIKNATLLFVSERSDVRWGGYSQIKCEMTLLKLATSIDKYQYYHLLSGEDLPIKTQDQIHKFFDSTGQKQFIRFESEIFSCESRVRYYHFFQEKMIRGEKHYFLAFLNKASLILQQAFGVHRNKGVLFQKGANWFSITDDLARYIVEKEKWIKETFKYTLCCDEIFLQTVVHNSDFKYQLYHPKYDNSTEALVRLIDWKRGTPYVFTIADLKEIMSSEMMFARKFDAAVDLAIIQKIGEILIKKKSKS